MKTSTRNYTFAVAFASLLVTLALPTPSHVANAASNFAVSHPRQYDDPYSDFRHARYSNAGLLSEQDEIKLGMQLHREVTKKYNLTDAGLARVDRLGQQCARASLRP